MTAAALRRIVVAGLLAGAVSGLALTGLQLLKVVPLSLAAHGGATPASLRLAAPGAGTGLGLAPAVLRAGADRSPRQRAVLAGAVNVGVGIGLALVLGTLFTLRGGVDTRESVLWGLGGYAAFFVLPSLGLPTGVPPGLLGAASMSPLSHHLWWLSVVLCSIGGLALVALRREGVAALAGAALLLTPYLVGAPLADRGVPQPPPALGPPILAASALANGVFWLLLALVSGFGHRKPEHRRRIA